MASVFVSHSQVDKELVEFFSTVFAATNVKACFEEFEKLATGQVTAAKVMQDIECSSAVFVLLSRNVANLQHTRDWVTWESGAGRMKQVWVFEPIHHATAASVAIPHLSHYVLYDTSDAWRGYLTQIVKALDDSTFLPAILGTGGAGAAVAKNPWAGLLVGGLAGIVLHATFKNSPAGLNITCPKCALAYAVHLPASYQSFRCPSCNTFLTLPEPAGTLHSRAAEQLRAAQARSLF